MDKPPVIRRRARQRYEQRRKGSAALRIALWSVGLLGLLFVVLKVAGVRFSPDPRYDRGNQLEAVRALNGELEALTARRPADAESDAAKRWALEVIPVMDRLGALAVDVVNTRTQFAREDAALVHEAKRGTRLIEELIPTDEWRELVVWAQGELGEDR